MLRQFPVWVLLALYPMGFLSAQDGPERGPASRPAPVGQGRAVCSNPVWDFGTEPQYSEVHHRYIVRNEGRGRLKILRVDVSCSCQAALPEKRILEPGESVAIKATFSTKSMSGPVHKPLTVVTDDPNRPTFQLMIKGRVQPPYWLVPAELNLGAFEKGTSPKMGEFLLVISRKAHVRVTGIGASSERLSVERLNQKPELRKDGSRVLRFKVGLKPGLPVGPVRETLTITTDLMRNRLSYLGVNAEVLGEIELSPRTFRLGRIKQGEEASRLLDIKKRGKPDLAIESLQVKPASAARVFAVKLITLEKGRHFRVRISVKPDAPARYHRGRLVIMTNCPGERVQQAYFYVSIRK